MTTDDSRETLPRPATAGPDDVDATQPRRSPAPMSADGPAERPAAPEPARQAVGSADRDQLVAADGGPGERAPTASASAAARPAPPVLPGGTRPERPAPRSERTSTAPVRGAARPAARPTGRARRARLVLQRLDPWSVFLFSLVASICLGIVLLVAVAALYAALSALGVLGSLNTLLGEVLGGADAAGAPFFTLGRVLGATAVLAAIDVVLLTVLATLGALLYNLCASLTGGVEVVLGERQ